MRKLLSLVFILSINSAFTSEQYMISEGIKIEVQKLIKKNVQILNSEKKL